MHTEARASPYTSPFLAEQTCPSASRGNYTSRSSSVSAEFDSVRRSAVWTCPAYKTRSHGHGRSDAESVNTFESR